MVTIAIIAAIAAIAVNVMSSNLRQNVRDTKLQADVTLLNQMVALYVGDGGSLSGVTSEQAVLDHLKRARPSSEATRQAGVSTGRFIDVRLTAKMGSGTLPTGQQYRAAWDTASQRFRLQSTSSSGVDEFYFDSSLTSAAFPQDTRQVSQKQFNNNNGWVWGSTSAASPANYVSPALVGLTPTNAGFNPSSSVPSATGSGTGSGTGTGTGSGGGTGTGTGSGSPAVPLPAPLMTPAGGTFAYSAFPSTVTISSNGAPTGQSTLMYQIDGGTWTAYSTPVTVSSGMTVVAQNVAGSSSVTNSPSTAQSYYQLVSEFDGSGAGSWTNPVGGANLVDTVTPGDPTTTFAHGNTRLDLGNGQYIDAGVQNTLSYTKNNFTGVQAGTPFTLGTLVMLNGTTFNNSEASSVTLHINLTLTNPPLTAAIDVPLGLISTPNSSDRLASADIVQLNNPAPFSTTINGVSYTLQLSWVSLDPSAGVVQGNQFLVFEGASAQAQLQATLVPNH